MSTGIAGLVNTRKDAGGLANGGKDISQRISWTYSGGDAMVEAKKAKREELLWRGGSCGGDVVVRAGEL